MTTDWPPAPQINLGTSYSGETPPGDIDQLLATMAERYPHRRWTASASGGHTHRDEDTGEEFLVPLRWYVVAVDEAGWMVSTYLPSVEIEEFWPKLLSDTVDALPRPTADR